MRDLLLALAVFGLFTVAAVSCYGGYSPKLGPSPIRPSPPAGSVFMVDCDGKRRELGRFVGEPAISPSFTAWTDERGALVRTRGFVLFVREARKK